MISLMSTHDLPLTLTIEYAGRLAGLNRQASYGCAARGEMPTIILNGRKRVLTMLWLRILNVEPLTASEPEAAEA